MKALDLARYILTKCKKDVQPINNLELQKILYYVQYKFLAKYGKPLFDDDFEARKFGPVVPDVYCAYSHMGAFKIGADYKDYDKILSKMSEDEINMLNDIIINKRDANNWSITESIHKKGKAWDLIFKNGEGLYDVISKELIRENAF